MNIIMVDSVQSPQRNIFMWHTMLWRLSMGRQVEVLLTSIMTIYLHLMQDLINKQQYFPLWGYREIYLIVSQHGRAEIAFTGSQKTGQVCRSSVLQKSHTLTLDDTSIPRNLLLLPCHYFNYIPWIQEVWSMFIWLFIGQRAHCRI